MENSADLISLYWEYSNTYQISRWNLFWQSRHKLSMNLCSFCWQWSSGVLTVMHFCRTDSGTNQQHKWNPELWSKPVIKTAKVHCTNSTEEAIKLEANLIELSSTFQNHTGPSWMKIWKLTNVHFRSGLEGLRLRLRTTEPIAALHQQQFDWSTPHN